jgi:hypothetical protein
VPPAKPERLPDPVGMRPATGFRSPIYDDVMAEDGDPEGDRVEVLLNGHFLYSATDDSFSQDGKVGALDQSTAGAGASRPRSTSCFASSWTPAMVPRWNADPFGFLRPWNEVPALMGSAPATPPSNGTGVVALRWVSGPDGVASDRLLVSASCGLRPENLDILRQRVPDLVDLARGHVTPDPAEHGPDRLHRADGLQASRNVVEKFCLLAFTRRRRLRIPAV